MGSYASGGAGARGELSRLPWRGLFNTDHKAIGLSYLWLALGSVLLGMFLSLLMRMHLVWPDAQIPLLSPLLSRFGNRPEAYTALTLLHGSLMVFFVLTTAPQAGFGGYFLPLQIGARDMAFPRMNLLAFWGTVVSLIGVSASFFFAPAAGLRLWTASVALFCLAALLNAVNFTVTTLDLRCKGMTLPRLPLTVWAWFVNAILSLLIFSILLGACVFLLSDLLLGSRFFSPLGSLAQESAPLTQSSLLPLWQRLFWFFAQAEVYVAILPCLGVVTHLLATFARKPVWKERAAVLALCGVGVFGFCVWGQHLFSSGLNPWSPLVFSVLASSLGIPALVLVASWLSTLWKGQLQLNTAMLFALGFVSLFLSGGASGIFLEGNVASSAAGNDLVTGHFHLVMGVAATFALLAALFFWFPKMFGRRLHERLGRWHFWLTFAGVYCVFMPMHWLGLMSGSRAVGVFESVLRGTITAATVVTVLAQGLFVGNFLWTILRGEKAGDRNPWLATTLEWSATSPPPVGNFGEAEPVVYRGAYEFAAGALGADFAAQNLEHTPWEPVGGGKALERSNAKETPKHQTK